MAEKTVTVPVIVLASELRKRLVEMPRDSKERRNCIIYLRNTIMLCKEPE